MIASSAALAAAGSTYWLVDPLDGTKEFLKGLPEYTVNVALVEAGIDGLLVDDTRSALARLAKAWRACFDIPLIAVTGSNGKTTVTQMIASILQAWHAAGGFATQGNLNNDIGLPLQLLRLRAGHRIAVLELGMNHPGEIAVLARIAQPTVALVNNAQREHQEFMASVEAVALENGAVLDALGPSGTAVFPSHTASTDSSGPCIPSSMTTVRPAMRSSRETRSASSTSTCHWSNRYWRAMVSA